MDDEAVELGAPPTADLGPGYSPSFPTSTSDAGRLELGRLVLSMAVIWLTIKVQVQAVLDKTWLSKKADQLWSDAGSQNPIVAVSEGLQYQDLQPGSTVTRSGDLVVLSMRVFYNGLELADEASSYLFRYNAGIQETLSELLPTHLSGIAKAVESLKIGGVRQVAITCPSGIKPYVPPGGIVLCKVAVNQQEKIIEKDDQGKL